MSKPTIYIAAGHGGNDPGAVSGKYIEKALTLKTALACQNYLRNYYGPYIGRGLQNGR